MIFYFRSFFVISPTIGRIKHDDLSMLKNDHVLFLSIAAHEKAANNISLLKTSPHPPYLSSHVFNSLALALLTTIFSGVSTKRFSNSLPPNHIEISLMVLRATIY